MSDTTNPVAPAAPLLPTVPLGLTLPANIKPIDAKAMITDAVNKLVPLDKHVAVVAVATEKGVRFASAQRVGDHLQFFEDVNFAHGSTGKGWSGEVGLVGVW